MLALIKALSAAPARLYYGWRMIAIGSAMRVLGGGLHNYGFAVFFLPITQDLGLSRTATSLAFSLARAEGAIEGPLAGYLIDRLGPRPIMLAGVILSGLGYVLLSRVDSYLAFLLVYLGMISLAFSAGFMHSPLALANTWFIRRRALAMTLISASVGVGGAVVAPLLSLAVQTWGWRTGALLAGLTLLVAGVPLASRVRRSPESMGLLPDGEPLHGPVGRPTRLHRQPGLEEADYTVGRAVRTPAFWMLAFATMFRVAGLSAVKVHFIPIMVWKGLGEQHAAVLLGVLALFSLPSHLVLGWVADRVHKPRLMGLAMMAATGALLILILAEAGPWLWLFALLFTVVEALFPITWATVGDFFGRRSFATIRGTMSLCYMWGSVVAPVIAGAVYDWSASYEPMLWGLAGSFLVAATLYALLVKPPAAKGERV